MPPPISAVSAALLPETPPQSSPVGAQSTSLADAAASGDSTPLKYHKRPSFVVSSRQSARIWQELENVGWQTVCDLQQTVQFKQWQQLKLNGCQEETAALTKAQKRLLDQAEGIAYDLYTSESLDEEPPLATQDVWLEQLDSLREHQLKVVCQNSDHNKAFAHRSPMALAELDPDRARNDNYFVMNTTHSGFPKPAMPRHRVIKPRYSVGAGIDGVAGMLAAIPLLYKEFGSYIEAIKVTSVSRQGLRPDGLILYLVERDRECVVSRKIGAMLTRYIAAADWMQSAPFMFSLSECEPSLPGAYGENQSVDQNKGFGSERSELIARAIINCLARSQSGQSMGRTEFNAELGSLIRASPLNSDCPALLSQRFVDSLEAAR